LARAKRHGEGFATLFIDLDRFKRINDTLGHAVGDAVLRQAAARLLTGVRESDAVAALDPDDENMVARLGGDEFVVLLRDVLAPRDAVVVATRMIAALAAPFFVEEHELVVTASIGIAMHPTDGNTVEDLIKAADAAMYAAKKLGRNTFQFFTQEMNTTAFEKMTLENELRHAIEKRQFVLYYQPKVDIRTGGLCGVEALIRWQHPQWGMVPPGRFITLAEELGLIVSIGDWVLEEACRQAAAWRQAGLDKVCIAVNLASPSFHKPGLTDEVRTLLDRYTVDPDQLQVEATESMLMESGGATLETLRQFNLMGIKLAIDDFGTGYSSLTYLRRFPADEIKIDRSFISEMTNNADDAAIVAAIISLGRSMKRAIVAEGVETIAQARLLHTLGCDVMQGFLFSRPVPADEMQEMLALDRPFAWAARDAALETKPAQHLAMSVPVA
jgi:diguanylate cyclase